MTGGDIVEIGPAASVLRAPRHPYTNALMASVPRDDMAIGELKGIPGFVPSVAGYPSGCRFHPRCSRKTEICAGSLPPLLAKDKESALACHNPLDGAQP